MSTLASAYVAAGLLGAGFGFQGSVSPGPLQTIIISETLSHGVRSSWRAAVISPCSDPIALVVAIFVVSNIPDAVLAIIAFLGASLLIRFAWAQFRTSEKDFDFQAKPRSSFLAIWLTNVLNPILWIFSFSINALQISSYYRENGLGVAATYLASFFISICFFNLTTACVVAKLKQIFNVRWLVNINRALGVFLVVVALRFVLMGMTKLSVL